MKRVLAASLFLIPAAACSDSNYYGEEFSLYYQRPASETRTERVERREIVHWPSNPADKKRIGRLYRYETLVEGSRTPRDCWYIFDPYGKTRLGFISQEGVFYRFNSEGRLGERVGEYPIQTTGLKIFFGIPLKENVAIEEIDPYK
jgi:hypothetical protein